MDPRTAYARRAELQILDVREDDEWVAGRIDGALHIPLGQLAARLGELTETHPIAAICRRRRPQQRSRRGPHLGGPPGAQHRGWDDPLGEGRAALHHPRRPPRPGGLMGHVPCESFIYTLPGRK